MTGRVKIHSGWETDSFDNLRSVWSRITSFQELQLPGTNIAVINMNGLSDEDLYGLGVQVGFKIKEEGYVFKSYQEWMRLYGSHELTSEDTWIRKEINPGLKR